MTSVHAILRSTHLTSVSIVKCSISSYCVLTNCTFCQCNTFVLESTLGKPTPCEMFVSPFDSCMVFLYHKLITFHLWQNECLRHVTWNQDGRTVVGIIEKEKISTCVSFLLPWNNSRDYACLSCIFRLSLSLHIIMHI